MSDQPPRPPFADIPEQGDDPIVWDPQQRRFVPTSEVLSPGTEMAAPVVTPKAPAGRDGGQFFVGADAVGKAPPPRDGSPPLAPPPPAQSLPRPQADPVVPAPAPAPVPAPVPAPSAPPSRGRHLPRLRRPKVPLKLLLIVLPILLPLLLIVGGLLYANWKFSQVHRVAVGSVLDGGGSGTNVLIVGSDTRAGADPNAPDAGGILGNATDRPPPGQRSDTIMVLHLGAGGNKMLSIPRDLIVTTADTGEKTRINASFNTDLGGGPQRLIKTVKQNLGIPINRYMEVDFVTFAGLVDAVGGITIDFPYPAFDNNTGLDIKTAGPQKLNGEQALAYVRSRHYTEIKEDGKPHEDPTADLGRIQRQQVFLQTVMGKVANSSNPFTLLKVGGEISKGIRLDDKLSLWGALQLAWDMKGLHPESVPLPVAPNRDNATLHLVEPDATGVLAPFK
jgi:LCP family protein required for cell wall assembly